MAWTEREWRSFKSEMKRSKELAESVLVARHLHATSYSAAWKWHAMGCKMSFLETAASVGALAQKYSCCPPPTTSPPPPTTTPPQSVLPWLLSGHSNQHMEGKTRRSGKKTVFSLFPLEATSVSAVTLDLICCTGKTQQMHSDILVGLDEARLKLPKAGQTDWTRYFS